MKLKLEKLRCKKCGHTWIPRKEDVRYCPKCKTAYWDVEKGVKENGENTNN